jgi:DNA (cytosine-5)-methyltransferase 1
MIDKIDKSDPITARPRLLDLFCGAGGAAMGYHRAGFDVVGVDNRPQPHYPFEFYQADALEFCAQHGAEYDVIHASPPCQAYSEATPVLYRALHPDLIAPTRDALQATGHPYVIENVESARALLVNPVMLCGTMFLLPIWRHRYFELFPRVFVLVHPCNHNRTPVEIDGIQLQVPVLCTGGGDGQRANRKTHRPRGKVCDIRLAMGIDWMVQSELTEAIPPAYTEFIGRQLITPFQNGAT